MQKARLCSVRPMIATCIKFVCCNLVTSWPSECSHQELARSESWLRVPKVKSKGYQWLLGWQARSGSWQKRTWMSRSRIKDQKLISNGSYHATSCSCDLPQSCAFSDPSCLGVSLTNIAATSLTAMAKRILRSTRRMKLSEHKTAFQQVCR